MYDGWVLELCYSPPYGSWGGESLFLEKYFKTEAVYNINRSFEIISANVDNDRYADVILIYNNMSPTILNLLTHDKPGYIVYHGSPYGLLHDPNIDVHFFNDDSYDEFSIGDFNADGKIDVLGLAKSGSFNQICNNELTMVSSPQWGLNSYQNPFTKRVTADINNDGLTDIIETYPSANTDITVNNSLNIIANGGGLVANSSSNIFVPFTTNFPTVNYGILGNKIFPDNELYSVFPIDYNGDGQVDLILGDIATQPDFWKGHTDKNESDWYFYKNVNGSFVYDTKIHWDQAIPRGNGATVMDVNFDGCLDLVVPKGSGFVAFTMPHANQRNLVNSITNGMGQTQSFSYTNYSDYDSYEGGGSVRNLKSPMILVKSFTDTNDDIIEYEFKEGKIHTDGKGFLGFSTVIEKNQLKNSKLTSNYVVDENYYRMNLESQIVSTYDDDPISTLTQSNETKVVNAAKKRFIPVVSSQTNTDELRDITSVSEDLNYDSDWNVTKSKTTVGDISTTINTSYKSRIEGGPLYLPETVTVTKEKGTEKNIRRTDYKYNLNGNLIREVKDSLDLNKQLLDENKLITEYKVFDEWGHATEIDITANGNTRKSTLQYTDNGYYLKTKTNNLNEDTHYEWDNDKGTLKNESDNWGHVTSYNYNKWGQLEETIFPDGNRTVSFLQWPSSDIEFGPSYGSYSESSGSSPKWIWYDYQGKKIVEESLGLDGKKIGIVTDYNPEGKVSVVYQPTFDYYSEWHEAATYTYDDYGRVKTITTPMGLTSYDYSHNDNKKVTFIQTPEKTTETTINDAGQIVANKVNGKAVVYDYYASGLTKSSTPEGGIGLSMEYNLQGNRVKLDDPDAEIIESKYDGFGNLLWENQKVHKPNQYVKTTNNYNSQTGLLECVLREGKVNETTVYTYDSDNNHKSRIKTIEISGKHKQTFSYDDLGRVTNTKEEIDGRTYNQGTTYDALGRVRKEIYPTGYYTINSYDNYGNHVETKDGAGRSIWKAIDENAKRQLLHESRGGKITKFDYDQRGFPTGISTEGVIKASYLFDARGNLEYRTNELDPSNVQKEVFRDVSNNYDYDAQNRLTKWCIYKNGTLVKTNTINYNRTTGNIESKSDLADCTMNYGEGNGKPHALTTITPNPNTTTGLPNSIPTDELTVGYTDFKKIATLDEGAKHYTISYGVDEERIKSVQTVNNTSITRYYLGDYEEEINSLGGIRKIHYLSGGAMMVNNNGVETLYYGYSDYQGSLLALTNESGTVLEKYAYDPWGLRRNPDDWSQKDLRISWITNRGYTGHEHLDAFSIINMNGRVYDPTTAMFISPDPYVQTPDDWLNYNRYSYVLNNPLKYSDPSGNLWYAGVGVGWSYYGGLSISVSGGYGFKGGLSVGITLGYGFGNNNFFATVNASAAGFYGYAGYDTKGGFIAGGGFAPLGTLYSGNAGFSFTSNVVDIGFSYSEHGGWSANICGAQYTRNGVIFDPSLGAGYTVNFSLERKQQQVVSTYTEIKAFLDETICLPEIPDVALAKVETKLAEMPENELLPPVSTNYKITSPYSESNRSIPELGIDRPHLAIDIGTPIGTTIKSPWSGKVVMAQNTKYGLSVVVSHDYKYNGQYIKTGYAHLSKMLVTKGQQIKRGDIIGYTGIWGTGPHLHFTLRIGEKVNPTILFPYKSR